MLAAAAAEIITVPSRLEGTVGEAVADLVQEVMEPMEPRILAAAAAARDTLKDSAAQAAPASSSSVMQLAV